MGSAPVLLSVGGVGNSCPVVTVKLPAAPSTKVVAFALVIFGASFTVRVKFWVASGPIPLCAVIVSG